MQLYAIFFGLVLLLYRKPAIGISLGICLVLSSMAALIWYIGGPLIGYPGDPDFDVGRRLLYKNHFESINHYGSYVIGLLLGYFMAVDKFDRKIDNGKSFQYKKYLPYIYMVVLQLYTVTLLVPLFILALPDEVPWIESTAIGSQFVNYFKIKPTLVYYMKWINISIQRQMFSTSFALFCYLLHKATDQTVDKTLSSSKRASDDNQLPETVQKVLNFIESTTNQMIDALINNLSNKYFVIFGRMSYSIFMVHYFVIARFMSSPTSNLSFSIFDTFVRACYVYVVAIFLGIILFLVIEAPFVSMLKSIGGKSSVKRKISCDQSKEE